MLDNIDFALYNLYGILQYKINDRMVLLIMRKRTHDEYVAKVAEINSNIEVIDKYINAHTKILHRCLVDGNEWYASPNNIIRGCSCPICGNISGAKKKARSHIDYVNKVKNVNQNIIVVGEYINSQAKILHKCLIDDCEWYAIPNNILKGEGCPRCSKKERYTTDSFKEKLHEIDDTIIVIGEYVHCKAKILCKCSIDGHLWEATPSNLLYGFGCPACNASHGEKNIARYLSNKNITFNQQYIFPECRQTKPLPFDFYIPDYNTCIEYDGIQHFEPIEHFGGVAEFEKRKRNDLIKNTFCNENNIVLLRIKYDQNVDSMLDNFFSMLTIQN